MNGFNIYDFTGIIHNDDSSDESDIEIDLELTEKDHDKVKTLAPVVDDEVTLKLLPQHTACIVIGND